MKRKWDRVDQENIITICSVIVFITNNIDDSLEYSSDTGRWILYCLTLKDNLEMDRYIEAERRMIVTMDLIVNGVRQKLPNDTNF